MAIARISKRSLELKFDEEKQLRTRQSGQYWRRGKISKDSKMKDCEKEEEIGGFVHIDLCKTEMMLEKHVEEDKSLML